MTIHIEEHRQLFKDDESFTAFIELLKNEVKIHDMVTLRSGDILGVLTSQATHCLIVEDLVRYHQILKTPIPVDVETK